MKKGKIVALGMSTLLVFASIPMVTYAKDEQSDYGERLREQYENQQKEFIVDEKEINRQSELNQLFQEIQDDMIICNENNVNEYESYYSGAYIRDEHLVVCVTDEENISHNEGEDIEYKVVDISYNELVEIQNEISEKYTYLYENCRDITEDKELLDSIQGIGIDEENNRVIVDVVGLSNKKEGIFEKLFGKYESVQLQEVYSEAEETATYRPGKAVYIIKSINGSSITYSRLSIGYRAYQDSSSGRIYGFVTCGHGIKDSINGRVYSDASLSNIIGNIVDWRYSGSLDAAFVEMTDENYIGTTTYYSDASGSTSGGDKLKSNAYVSTAPAGTTVYKVGSTTYKTSGIIKNTNYTVTISGTTFTNLTKASNLVESGDSGGLVYTYVGGNYVAIGVVKGNCGSGIGSYSFYVKAYEIGRIMNVYPY